MRFVQFLFFRHALARDFSLEPIIYDIWWRFSPPNSERSCLENVVQR